MANNFGLVTDYFSIATSANGLRLMSAQDGMSNAVTETAELSTFVARDVGAAYKSPTCIYAITKAADISLTLGNVYNGFMLTAVELRTQAGQLPTLTLTGVENEGSNAIQTHTVSLSLSPRARAIDPLSAVSVPSGAYLNDCVTEWIAEPVIVMDMDQIVASDIQHGRVDVSATIVATSASGTPGAASTFDVRSAASLTAANDAYRTYAITVTKSL